MPVRYYWRTCTAGRMRVSSSSLIMATTCGKRGAQRLRVRVAQAAKDITLLARWAAAFLPALVARFVVKHAQASRPSSSSVSVTAADTQQHSGLLMAAMKESEKSHLIVILSDDVLSVRPARLALVEQRLACGHCDRALQQVD